MLYILYGEDEYSLYEALDEIKKGLGDRAMLDINTTVLEAQQLTLEQVKAAGETVPFMAPGRLVIIKGLLLCFESRSRADAQNKSVKAEKRQEEYRAVVEYLKNTPASTVLVLVDAVEDVPIKAGNHALKELSARAEVKTFPPLRGINLRQWVQKYAARNGTVISTEAQALLSESIGSDLRVMASELDKLIAYASGKAISADDVKAVVSYAHEFSIFNLVDAILEFQASTAEKSMEQLLLRGVVPVQMLAMLARQLRILVRTIEMKGSGISDAEMQSKLGINNSFVWRKAQAQAGSHSLERIKHIYDRLLETDLAIKTGKYNEDLALNMLIAELCQRG